MVRGAQSMRGAQQFSLIGLTGRHLGDDLASEQHDRPVANETYFGKLGREQEHRRPRIGHLPQQPIDLMFCADINAARRIEAKQRLKPSGDPSCDHHLCWLPPLNRRSSDPARASICNRLTAAPTR